MLAVAVGHLECARILLERGADATLQSAGSFTRNLLMYTSLF